MKIKYNSPVILTYALICIVVLLVFSRGTALLYLTSPARLAWDDPVFYFRSVAYIAGHDGWQHLIGNLVIILLVGPLTEEKYGSTTLPEEFRDQHMVLFGKK